MPKTRTPIDDLITLAGRIEAATDAMQADVGARRWAGIPYATADYAVCCPMQDELPLQPRLAELIGRAKKLATPAYPIDWLEPRLQAMWEACLAWQRAVTPLLPGGLPPGELPLLGYHSVKRIAANEGQAVLMASRGLQECSQLIGRKPSKPARRRRPQNRKLTARHLAILEELSHHAGNVTAAAKSLGISRQRVQTVQRLAHERLSSEVSRRIKPKKKSLPHDSRGNCTVEDTATD